MSEDRDFDYVVGKLPRKDKDGKDTTGDKIGKGGRHRDDGTFSSMAYDLEVVDKDPTKPIPTPPPKVIVRREPVPVERQPVRYEDLPWWGQILADVTDDLLNELKNRALDSFDRWLWERRRKKEEARRMAKIDQQQRTTDAQPIRSNQIQEEKTATSELSVSDKSAAPGIPDGFDSAYEQYTIHMTSEEAQKELLDAFVLYVLSARKVWRVSHAEIKDTAGNIADGKAMIEKLSNPALLENINHILDHNPALLEEWQSIALSSILGHRVVEEGKFVPIEINNLRSSLVAMNGAEDPTN